MYQKDFILRMLEMIGDLVAGIFGLIKKGEFQQASESLNNAYSEFLKNDAALFRSIPKEKLTSDLLHEHNYTNDHLEILSELFYAEAELLFAKGSHPESREYYEKTLILLEFVNIESNSFSIERQSKAGLIKDKIAQLKDGTI